MAKIKIPAHVQRESAKLQADPMSYLGKNIAPSFYVQQVPRYDLGVIETEEKRFLPRVWGGRALVRDSKNREIKKAVFVGYGSDYRSKAVSYRIAPKVVWICEGAMWECEVNLTFFSTNAGDAAQLSSCSVEEPKLQKRLTAPAVMLFDKDAYANLESQMRADSPYNGQVMDKMDLFRSPVRAEVFYSAPQIELLYNEGYTDLVQRFVKAFECGEKARIDEFYRLTKPGKTVRDVFKVLEPVYKALKKEHADLQTWDFFRRLSNTGRITTEEDVSALLDMSLGKQDYPCVESILRAEWEEKPVFTVASLARYISRTSANEAILPSIALEWLSQYLSLCKKMEERPNVESTSLAREVDTAVKRERDTRGDREAVLLQKAGEALQDLDFEDGEYFIRGLQNREDIRDEFAQQQVGYYSCERGMLAGKRYFTMRRKASPNRALVTVELGKSENILTQNVEYGKRTEKICYLVFLDNWLDWMKAGRPNGLWQKVLGIVDSSAKPVDDEDRYLSACMVLDELMRTGSEDAARAMLA